MKIELNRDWTEFLCALISRRVRFLVIGGHAVAGHGEPRLTEDLDVFVDRDVANVNRLREALVDFGFGAAAPQSKEFARPYKVFMLGRKPWRIDILTRSGARGTTIREHASKISINGEAVDPTIAPSLKVQSVVSYQQAKDGLT